MASENSLHRILDRVAKKMQVDLEESGAIQHRGSKGTVRERDVQRDFLQKYLPSVARATGSGELVSVDGQVSGQCDLMVVDADTPPLWAAEDYAIVPVECCHVTVEVKSNLTVEELRKSWAAAKRAKTLPRTAYLPSPMPISLTRQAYGRQWEHAFPLRSIVFAYDSATLDTLGKEMSILAQQDPDPAMGVDAVCVLNRGTLSWIQTGTSAMFDRHPDSMVFTSSTTPGNVLLFLLASINSLLSSARYNDRFDVKRYITESLGNFNGFWRDGDRYEGDRLGEGTQIIRMGEE
jgi:hypothetical protein